MHMFHTPSAAMLPSAHAAKSWCWCRPKVSRLVQRQSTSMPNADVNAQSKPVYIDRRCDMWVGISVGTDSNHSYTCGLVLDRLAMRSGAAGRHAAR